MWRGRFVLRFAPIVPHSCCIRAVSAPPGRADAAAGGDVRAGGALRRSPELALRVPDEDYERLLDYADGLGVEDYFWQEGGAAEESFIPPFDLTGV